MMIDVNFESGFTSIENPFEPWIWKSIPASGIMIWVFSHGRYMTDKIPMGRTGKLDEVCVAQLGNSYQKDPFGRTPVIP